MKKKIFDLKKKKIYVDDIMIKKIKEEVLALFNDNYLTVEEIKNRQIINTFGKYMKSSQKKIPHINLY